jgi:sortase A
MQYLPNKIWISFLLVIAVWQLGHGTYIQAKALLAQVLLENAWEETRQGKIQAAPWPWADTWPVARLIVPRLDVDLIILAGDTGRTLAFGPGYNFASALPGEDGNSIISAHRDTHFRFLRKLKEGDRIIVQPSMGPEKTYRVKQQRIVDAYHGTIPFEKDQSSLHLITCYPFNSIIPETQQRFIVSAGESVPREKTNI